MTTTPPTNPTPEPIEQQLASATQWTGGDTALWQRALDQVEREATPARPSILATINRHARMAAMIAFGTIAVIVAAVTTSQTSRRADFSSAPAVSASIDASRTTASAPARAEADVMLGRKLEFDQQDAADLPASPPVAMTGGDWQPALEPDVTFHYFDSSNDRVAAADIPRPGSDNPLSQVFAGQHANLPPAPEAEAALRERTAARAPSPVEPASAPAPLASLSPADDQLALGKAASEEARTQVLDGETYSRRDMTQPVVEIKEATTDPRPATPPPAPRAIVRTVNINLGVTDVRAAFSSIESAVGAAPAAYIESSELHGEGRAATASIVVRVPAEQLDPLVAVIRPLGKVLVETSAAQDVGEQLVDLQARLTNAQRFEGELLETLNKTSGAKPNEILEVQRAVSEVRENIERLAAQRARLSRQIALSTIRISLTADPVDPTPARAEGLTGYLGRQLHNAWRGGLVAVADSFAWLVSVLVGGALWCALLIIALLLTRRWLKKRPR